jgi:hypothetical protein
MLSEETALRNPKSAWLYVAEMRFWDRKMCINAFSSTGVCKIPDNMFSSRNTCGSLLHPPCVEGHEGL